MTPHTSRSPPSPPRPSPHHTPRPSTHRRDRGGSWWWLASLKGVGAPPGLRLTLYLTLLAGWTAGQPDFAGPLNNVSVPVGRDATFSCIVNDLGGYRGSSGRKDALQVGWVKADTKAIQAIHKHVITHNSRVSVSHSDHNTWMLHIRGVQEEDRGPYMCQINTDPMRSQIGYLEVTVPPEIDDNQSSSDVMVPEGSNAVLTCHAQGYPPPKIIWMREDKKTLVIRKNDPEKRKVKSMKHEGENLNLTSITRSDMGPYLCIANNNVPPSVSKRIIVDVSFRPVIHVPNQLIGVPIGSEAKLQCNLEASPKSIQYWTRDTGAMLINNSEFLVEESHTNYYMTSMTLTILNFSRKHEGMYFCSAKNSLGETEGNIKVYEIQVPTEAPTEDEGDMTQAGRGYTGAEISNEVVYGAGAAGGDGSSSSRSRGNNGDTYPPRRRQEIIKGHVTKATPSQTPGDHMPRRPPGHKVLHPTNRPSWIDWDKSATSTPPQATITNILLLVPLLCLAMIALP